ncbi:hypothetical protein H0H92_015151 [Tricholoma furcatifolium]|nr:hypothetical protein H0H92_015151 [Tricholoma furcatifolium]
MTFLFELPEELLRRILANLIKGPPNTQPALFYVSQQFNRIATPLLYQSIHLSSASVHLLERTLIEGPHLRPQVKSIIAGRLWSPEIRVLELCTGLQALDLTIMFEPGLEDGFGDNVRVSDTFSNLVHMRHLTLRTQARGHDASLHSTVQLDAFSIAIERAIKSFKLQVDTPMPHSLHGTPFAFPIISVSYAPVLTGISVLASSLASSPALHTFLTHLPDGWVSAIATIATNPALQKIVLEDGLVEAEARSYAFQAQIPPEAPIPSSVRNQILQTLQDQFAAFQDSAQAGHNRHPFIVQAQRYPRLVELIAAGTTWSVRDSPLAQT